MMETLAIAVNTTPLDVLEEKVTNLLKYHAKDEYSKNTIAPHVAKASLMPKHLYQDLGFKNRIEMGKYMKEHFPSLAKQKPNDKLWKKYIYDIINEVAPACATCPTQSNCFLCKLEEQNS